MLPHPIGCSECAESATPGAARAEQTEETHADPLLDHPIRGCQQRRRHGEAEGLELGCEPPRLSTLGRATHRWQVVPESEISDSDPVKKNMPSLSTSNAFGRSRTIV
jgi:hypothetical protein